MLNFIHTGEISGCYFCSSSSPRGMSLNRTVLHLLSRSGLKTRRSRTVLKVVKRRSIVHKRKQRSEEGLTHSESLKDIIYYVRNCLTFKALSLFLTVLVSQVTFSQSDIPKAAPVGRSVKPAHRARRDQRLVLLRCRDRACTGWVHLLGIPGGMYREAYTLLGTTSGIYTRVPLLSRC